MLRTGVAIADAAELVLDEAAIGDDELELVRVLEVLRVEGDVDVGLIVEVVDLALLGLGKEEAGDNEELTGDEDELEGAELPRALIDETLAMEEAATAMLEDEEAAIGMFRDDEAAIGLTSADESAELLELRGEIDVLTLLIMSTELFRRNCGIRTC